MTPTAEEQQAFQAFLAARDAWDGLYDNAWAMPTSETVYALGEQLRAARDRLVQASSCQCPDACWLDKDGYSEQFWDVCSCPCEKCQESA